MKAATVLASLGSTVRRSSWPSFALSRSGCSRLEAGGALDGVREFGWVRRRQHDHRRAEILLPRRGEADGGVRIDHHAGFRIKIANGHLGLMLIDRMGGEQRAQLGKFSRFEMEGSGAAKLVHARPDSGGVTAGEFEQQPLEIARKLNIHARAGGGDHAPWLVNPRRQSAGKTVVEVRGNNEAFDRQAHGSGGVTRENITEISGGHGEGDGAVGAAEGHGRGEVIDDLRKDAGEVDRIDAGQRKRIARARVVEQRLHDALAIVEGALNRDVVHVRLVRARHLPPLHLGHPALGVKDENVDHVEAAEGLDGGGTGIAGGGADDRRPRALPAERAVHQPRHHLHGEVLEGERRPVKQLEQPARGRNLPERRDGRMMEAGIGVVEHGFKVCRARVAFKIGAHDAVSGFRIVEAGEGFDLGRRKTRPGFRHGEAAVAGKAREQRALEGKRRGFAPCAHIPQD